MNHLIICSNDLINMQFESRSFYFNGSAKTQVQKALRLFFKGKHNEDDQYLTLKLSL